MNIVVLGAAGGLGRNVLDAARAAGHHVTAFVRDARRAKMPAGVRVVTGDATRVADVRLAIEGADAAVFCVNPAFSDWVRAFPPLLDAAVAAARANGTRLVFPANVWIYGPGRPGDLVDESRAPTPSSVRGRLRAAMEATLRDRGVRYAMLRLPEFYGPHVVTLTARVCRAALADSRTMWPGPLDVPIELVFMPDAGRALVDLAAAGADVDGQVFHLPGHRTTARGFVEAVYAAAGHAPRAWGVPQWVLRAAGVFDSTARAAADVGHLWTHPVLLDGARFTARFGAPVVTPMEPAVAATLAWHCAAPDARLQG